MPTQPFDAVIFDMDGVLTDSEPFIAAAVAEMLRQKYGLALTRADFAAYVGTGEDRFISGPAADHGVAVDLAIDKARTYEIYLEMIRGALGPLPGARAFVAELREAGVRLALATSSDRVKMAANLAEAGFPQTWFEVVVVGEEAKHKKPDPAVFLLAAERLGADPARCLVVEDAPNGVRAAVAAGAPCLGVGTTFPLLALQEAGATYLAPDLASVPDEVRGLLGLRA